MLDNFARRMIGLPFNGINHKEHKAHKGLAKVNRVLEDPTNLGAGFVPL
jgi:hypothetical protein